MKKLILLIVFSLFGVSVNAQTLDLVTSVLGKMTDNNAEMVTYLQQINTKMGDFEKRNKATERKQKTAPNPLLVNSQMSALEKDKADVIQIAKILVSSIKTIGSKKISNSNEAINAIMDISKFSVQTYLQTKKLMTFSTEAIENQDKLQVINGSSTLLKENKKQLLWINEQLKTLR